MWQSGHVGGQNNSIISWIIYKKMEFSSQRREMLLFFATNMAAVTSYQPEISTLAGTIIFITKAQFL